MDRDLIGLMVVILALVGLLVGCATYSAKMQAKVINKKYGTDYTTKEMFFAGDTIQKVVEGQKHKIELTHKDE